MRERRKTCPKSSAFIVMNLSIMWYLDISASFHMGHVRPLNMQPQEVVEQPQIEKQTGERVETSTQGDTSNRGRVRAN